MEKRAFTWEELDSLYAVLDDDRMGPYFTVLAELGLRNQEADALSWTVFLEGRRVRIHRAVKRGEGGVPIGIGALKAARTSRPSKLSGVAGAALHAGVVSRPPSGWPPAACGRGMSGGLILCSPRNSAHLSTPRTCAVPSGPRAGAPPCAS